MALDPSIYRLRHYFLFHIIQSKSIICNCGGGNIYYCFSTFLLRPTFLPILYLSSLRPYVIRIFMGIFLPEILCY